MPLVPLVDVPLTLPGETFPGQLTVDSLTRQRHVAISLIPGPSVKLAFPFSRVLTPDASRTYDGVKFLRRGSSVFRQFEAKIVTGRLCGTTLLLLFLFIAASRAPLAGQFGRNDSTTLSNKTVATPRSLEAFTGTLTTIKTKGKVITLETDGGDATEIFSCRNGPAIRTIAGQKMKFKALKPGMMVVVYYSSRKGRRTVKDVLVLKAKPAKKEAESASPES